MSRIPAEALNQHIAILGKTGSGKTYAAKGIVEGLLRAHRQTCIIDPTGAWWGLRLAADGRGKGLDVVLLGGEHADIPLAERSGAAVARLVTEQRASVVLDTSGFTVGQQTRWFIDFAEALYSTIRNPLHLVIDEAHNFMPQGKVISPDAGKMLHAGNRLMSGGRSRGIRAMLITQRPQKLHHDTLSVADTLVAMRVLDPRDRDAMSDWVKGTGDPTHAKDVLDSLASLARGEGWVWYPEGGHLERTRFPAITTYDSSAAPKHGAKSAPVVGGIDLSEVKAALADAVKEAEANDPKLLRKRIADLERAARERPAETKTVEVVKTVEVPVLNNGLLDRTDKLVHTLQAAVDKVAGEVTELRRLIAPAFVAKPAARPVAPRPQVAVARTAPKPARQPSSDGAPSLGNSGKRRMLVALAQNPDGLTQTKLSILTGIARKGGTWRTYLGELRGAGWVEDLTDRRLRITDDGLATLGDYDPLPTGPALIDYWQRQLGDSGKKRIFNLLVSAYPHTLSQEEIAAETGIEIGGGTWRTYLGELRGLELVTGRGELRASEDLF